MKSSSFIPLPEENSSSHVRSSPSVFFHHIWPNQAELCRDVNSHTDNAAYFKKKREKRIKKKSLLRLLEENVCSLIPAMLCRRYNLTSAIRAARCVCSRLPWWKTFRGVKVGLSLLACLGLVYTNVGGGCGGRFFDWWSRVSDWSHCRLEALETCWCIVLIVIQSFSFFKWSLWFYLVFNPLETRRQTETLLRNTKLRNHK